MSLFKTLSTILPLTVFILTLSVGVEGWENKRILVNSVQVDSAVLERRSSIFVTMSNGTESTLSLISSQGIKSASEKALAIMTALEAHSESTQAPVVNVLKRLGVAYKSFWVSNQIFIKDGSPSAVIALLNALTRDSSIVSEIREEIVLPQIPTFNTAEGERTLGNAWGVDQIRAPEAWKSEGVRGKGIRVGVIDTGSRSTHKDLVGRLEDGGWLDPLTNSAEPYDDQGHGTHIIGTILGQNGIGVAPDATYVACKACDKDGCYESGLKSCGQFLLCPDTGKCSQTVHVASSSLGYSEEEKGGGYSTFFDEIISTWREADIVPVFPIGNKGPVCGSSGYPGASLLAIGVGAVDANRNVANFSSVGPLEESKAIKPDLTAPGVDIKSASHESDTDYRLLSDTSTSAAHVAGLVALLLSKDGGLKYHAILENLRDSSNRGVTSKNAQCGGKFVAEFPNFIFGHGEIDCVSALKKVGVGRK